MKFFRPYVVDEYVLNVEVLKMLRQNLVYRRIVAVHILFRTYAENDFEFFYNIIVKEMIKKFLRKIRDEFGNIDDLSHSITENCADKSGFIVCILDIFGDHSLNITFCQTFG